MSLRIGAMTTGVIWLQQKGGGVQESHKIITLWLQEKKYISWKVKTDKKEGTKVGIEQFAKH